MMLTKAFRDVDDVLSEFDDFFPRAVPYKRGWMLPSDNLLTEMPTAHVHSKNRRFPMDVIEHENDIAIIADLPGVKKEDVNIRLDDGWLTIEGERKEERKHEGTNDVTERYQGKYYRRYRLPSTVDTSAPDKLAAKFEHGTLTVVLPKMDPEKAKGYPILIE